MTNYISLYIMKGQLAPNSQVNNQIADVSSKAREVTQQILNTENGIQALIQVIYTGKEFFDINLDALIDQSRWDFKKRKVLNYHF